MSVSGPLRTADAYRIWSETYEAENVVTALEDAAAGQLTPAVTDVRLLDVACGTGRRLRFAQRTGPRLVVGVDLVHEMLAYADRGALIAQADMRALPIADHSFDVIWCRLAIGHVPDLVPAYRELHRVAAAGANVIITDFHPAAVEAGHTRSFRDAGGLRHTVEHFAHSVADHRAAAEAAGLVVGTHIDACVSPNVRHFYEIAGRLDAYERQTGLPLVLALSFRA